MFGIGLLGLAALLGESESVNRQGFLVAFFGFVVSGTGSLLSASFVMPTIVSTLSRALGTDAPSTIAARNAVKDPRRTTRSTMGLVIGVALVPTFSAGATTLQAAVASWDMPAEEAAAARQSSRWP